MQSTKKALLLSMMSMLLCVAMLMGTTFAWFTDSVTSGVNTITAGNLDIELEYSKTGEDGSWETVEGKTDLFSGVTLWEPGATSVVYLKITNKGTLALKYNLAIKATGGNFTNAAGQSKNLKDALKFAQVAGDTLTKYATREAAVAATSDVAIGLNDYAQANHMAANAVSYVTLVVTMPTDIGNEFNYKTGTTAPEIQLGIKLNATQYTAESDSFGIDYDENAVWPEVVGSAAELGEALAGNKPIQLTQDMDITDIDFTKDTEMNLGGHTITSNNANTIANGQNLTMKNGELKFTDDHSFTYIDVRPGDSTEGVYTFEGMKFTSEKKDPTYGPSTDRIEKLVALTAEKNNVAKFIFKDCVFNNAKVLFSGMGEGGSFNATFENCTFTGLGSSEFIDASSNYVSGTITIKNCTFTMEATSSSAAAIDANSHVTVKFEGVNTVNITVATPVPNDVKVNGTVTSAKVVSGAATVTGKDTVTVTGIAQK